MLISTFFTANAHCAVNFLLYLLWCTAILIHLAATAMFALKTTSLHALQ